MNTFLKKHLYSSLMYLWIAVGLGTFLRWLFVVDLPFTYRYIVHTHSHIALLGWVYLGITTLFYKFYLYNPKKNNGYTWIFLCTHLVLLGMLISFPIQGYAVWSIVFSTAFLIISYIYSYYFFKKIPLSYKNDASYKCFRAALYYMILSSLGPWALGIIMNTLGQDSIWYRIAIYFYLHFQYNGWMLLALIGFIFFILERNNVKIPSTQFRYFFRCINTGILLTFFLSTLWTHPHEFIYVLSGIGCIFQGLAFFELSKLISYKQNLKPLFSLLQQRLFITISVFLGIKIALQFFSVFPNISELISASIDLVIAYLHWTFLGILTLGLFFFFDYFQLIRLSKKVMILYFIGFGLTESLLVYKSFIQHYQLLLFDSYYTWIAVASTFFFIAISGIIFYTIRKHHTYNS